MHANQAIDAPAYCHPRWDALVDELTDLPQWVQQHQEATLWAARARDAMEAAILDYMAVAKYMHPECTVQLLSSLETSLLEALKRHEAADATTARARWRAWVDESLERGAKRAHAWSKLPQGWAPKPVWTHGRWSADPVHLLEAEMKRLGELWQVEQKPPEAIMAMGERCFGPELTAEEVLAASKTFPVGTAWTFDGIHPRHLSLFPELAGSWAQLMMAVEANGFMPNAIRAIVSALIPKVGRPGNRSIALFPGFYRAWARCRRSEARSWEAKNPCKHLLYQAGGS